MDAELIAAIAAGGKAGAAAGGPAILVTVLETRGSAPRHAGS